MQPFISHTGIAAPLRISDVDTDQIIPARYCAGVTKDGLAATLFADWRADDAQFVLNQDPFRAATILVAGENFGSGSSREWAVWALQDYGFRAILAPGYGDIFRGNALKNGLLVVDMSGANITEIWDVLDHQPGSLVSVDLNHRSVTVGSNQYPFALDDDTRWRLMNGFDDVALTLQHAGAIDTYEDNRRTTLPVARSAHQAGVSA